ncbi:hypothetical protein ACFFX1_37065 [Dactylosporangium sucinum]|uniref:Uncharacterized protein n=1 Tax=Dactylosporangium sucinum TaxID=1424081 RepID=A0A917UE56_9ACTN|nr:hypothetical protein [Dactylosporangium sucinum]GGM81270.1 hypothetical protein GCM10007977_098340 [Dactylosporangium sucinum]
MYAYAGFPRSLNALGTFMTLLDQRRADGITDLAGDEPKPLLADIDILVRGTANQTQLSGAPVPAPCSSARPRSTGFSKRTCSATSSAATTSTGKAARSPLSPP